MKSIKFMPFWGVLFAFLISSSLVSAQFKVNSSGQVGIGKDPQYKLDVAGDIYIGSVSNIFGTTNNIPITFKVNGSLAGSTGSSTNTNVSFGYGAFNSAAAGLSNTVIGNNALSSNTNGGGNTANGSNALSSNLTGSGNTALGSSALASNTTGFMNTAIGSGANVSSSGLSYATAIGAGAIVDGSYKVIIGNTSVGTIGGNANWSNLSDGRAKKNIRTNVPGLAFINSLQPVTYNLDLNALDNLLGIDKMKDSGMDMPPELKDIEKKARETKEKQIQTGFIAQDVEKAAKSFDYDFSGVDVGESGVYALRYAEFVVPLVKAVQELSEQNDRLKEQVAELTGLVNKLIEKDDDFGMFRSGNNDTSITGINNLLATKCKLYQNAPNPFKERTEIRYYLPPEVQSAEIYIFNLQGSLLKKIPASNTGLVEIKGSHFNAGMYVYTLVADGQAVDTKRMILTK